MVDANVKKIMMLDVVVHGHMACKESRLICQRVGSLIPLEVWGPSAVYKCENKVDVSDDHALTQE